MLTKNRVVVTGLGVVAPNGIGVEAFWQSLLENRSGIGPITLFDTTGLRCKIAGEVKGFDPALFIPPEKKVARRMGRSQQFAVAATKMALADAQLHIEALRSYGEIPVIMGVSSSALDLQAGVPASWKTIASVPHAVASEVAYTLGFKARLLTLSNGCCSSLDAIGVAAKEIAAGRSEISVVGSGESVMSRYVFECFDRSRKLSLRNDEPQRASRPFDRDRDGGLASEGAGVVIMESLEHALSRGVVPYLEVIGYASSADPADTPEGTGLEKTMQAALINACRQPEDVDAVNAHAPSDPDLDAFETHLIKRVLGKRAYQIPVTSIKGAIGNPMGAAGVCQLIAMALSFRHGVIPPTTNLENPDPRCDLDHVPRSPRAHNCRLAIINSHGFGRGNTTLVVQSCPSSVGSL